MTDHRYDGSLDAPPAPGSLCVEPECGLPRSAMIHLAKDGHFFNGETPLLTPVSEPVKPAATPTQPRTIAREKRSAPSAPPPAPRAPETKPEPPAPQGDGGSMEAYAPAVKAGLRCVHCRKPRNNHRGPIDHKFEPPAAETSAPEFVSPTPAQILAELERVLRLQNVAPRLRIKSTQIRGNYAATCDTELLSASVTIDVSLIFPREME